MNSFPIFLEMEGRDVLVVGGTDMAANKVRLLAKTPARVVIVAEGLDPAFREFEDLPNICFNYRPFEAGDVLGKALVYAATHDEETDAKVCRAARAAGVPVNVVDKPELCQFTTPAIVDRAPLTVAISSSGQAPTLARKVRAAIDELLPSRLGTLTAIAGGFRNRAKALIPDAARRRRFWDRVFAPSKVSELLALEATRIPAALESLARSESGAGRVILVGAGPGDPDLLTLKAHRALSEADVIVYDRLVGEEILDYARRDAERIFVGKSRGDHTLNQDEINELLVQRARAGEIVVRLKGGDPFVFGRAGEEIEALRRANVAIEIVPGVTAAAACAATSHIPLTHREFASAVTLVTGQLKAAHPQDWRGLAGDGRTLAIYMGLAQAERISEGLIGDGLDPLTPVAVIENGSRADERQLFATLQSLPQVARENRVKSPAMIIVGEVAALAKDWPAELLDAEFNPLAVAAE